MRAWGYRCELTRPQVALMMSDLPHTLYNFSKNKSNKTEANPTTPKTFSQDERSLKLQEEALRQAQERRAKREQSDETQEGVSLDELFNGLADDAPIMNEQ